MRPKTPVVARVKTAFIICGKKYFLSESLWVTCGWPKAGWPKSSTIFSQGRWSYLLLWLCCRLIYCLPPLLVCTDLCLFKPYNKARAMCTCCVHLFMWTEVCVWSNKPHTLFILLATPASCTLQNLNNKAIHTRAEWLHEVMGWVGLLSLPLGQLSFITAALGHKTA